MILDVFFPIAFALLRRHHAIFDDEVSTNGVRLGRYIAVTCPHPAMAGAEKSLAFGRTVANSDRLLL